MRKLTKLLLVHFGGFTLFILHSGFVLPSNGCYYILDLSVETNCVSPKNFKNEMFLDMDTRYFDNKNIRDKAKVVDESQLYGLYYDYDSAFEHGLWGAIRESSLLNCNNPLHHYHCVPDINDAQNLKSVWPDCVMVMNKTINVLDEIYGIPNPLLKGILDFEK